MSRWRRADAVASHAQAYQRSPLEPLPAERTSQRHEFHGNWNYTIPAEPPGETTRPNEGN